MLKTNGKCEAKRKEWPKDCIWPEPVEAGYGSFWEAEDAEMLPLDEEGEDLLAIKYYMDELVEIGRLNEDYSLNEDWEDWDSDDKDAKDDVDADDEDAKIDVDSGDEDVKDYEDVYDKVVKDDEVADDENLDKQMISGGIFAEEEEFVPEEGEDYWDHGFDIESWEMDLIDHLNLLKLPLPSPVDDIERITGYEFINENLLRQAFTRRSFGLEYGIGDNEILEFIGDAVLNIVVTREMARQLTRVETYAPNQPFCSSYTEGNLTRIRSHFVSKEYLNSRALELGLDQYILYGNGEESGENARENVMEALIGAVAADCDWDWYTLEAVVDRLLCIQLFNPNHFLDRSYYDIFNAWHQKHFGRMPEYEVSKGRPMDAVGKEFTYYCTLRFFVPDNDAGVDTYQRIDVERETRSKAREIAAELAYHFVVSKGLWMRLEDAGIKPDLENSINQLQELYQKKYVEQPEYTFEQYGRSWRCDCRCGSFDGWGNAEGKVKAKKEAAYMVLKRMMKAAGICQ